MRFETGSTVRLTKPYLGYTQGEVVGYEYPYYLIELSSGKVISLYGDEIESC